jgi:branched-subunit amino acid aminotransferase/4-amino-4-deoxychorismate lyase
VPRSDLFDAMMKRPVCFLNGRYVDVARAVISATDRGFLYGEGLFETWRTYRGRPFAVEEHVARLARSARALGIPFDETEDWEARSVELARRNGAQNTASVLRLTITRGSGPLQLAAPRTSHATRLLLLRPLEAGLAGARETGVAVHLLAARDQVCMAGGSLKTLNYLPAVIGKTAAKERGCFEAIYRQSDGSLLEGTTSNLFVVNGGTISTPPLSAGVLPGVTRALVLGLARRLAPVREEPVTEAALHSASEAFLTATSIEVVPIVRAGRRVVGDARPGPLTRELQRRYRKLVARRRAMDAAQLGD